MKYPYLNDAPFLKELDLQRIKEQYIKITVLDWNENPIQDLTGIALGGSINLDGSSSVRRTANINVLILDKDNPVTNPNYLLSINKKISIEIGLKNNTSYYKDYNVLWFPMGIYVIIQNSISHSLSGTNISLQLKDKMCLLNGECGGVLPASVNFNELETIDEKGQTVIINPTLYQIIQEAVNHWGGEQLGKIIINNLDTRVKKVVQWTGSSPIYSYDKGNGVEFTVNESTVQNLDVPYKKYLNGQDIGYVYTDFTYVNGDLIGDAGSSVCDILDQIRDALGNYEYFYDLDGNFVFQEIPNYLNTSHAKIELDKMQNSDYVVDQTKGKSVYNFNDSALISSYNNSPQFNMIKNDFIVWGQRKDATGKQYPIRYHLAIDTKPPIGEKHQVFQYKDPQDGLMKAKTTINVNHFSDLPQPGAIGVFYFVKENEGGIYKWDPENQNYELIPGAHITEVVAKDWRTELYLQGVDAEPYSTDSNPYYVELQNEWPKLYDIWGDNPGFYQSTLEHPSDCDFFLDFIDATSAISEFSISNIGRRTKTIVDDKINCLFEPEVPDLIILNKGKKDKETLEKERNECIQKGQNFTQVDASIFDQLASGGKLNSAYNEIKNLLYQYTSYNESISLQCIPIYYLDANTRISVTDLNSDIYGDYIIHNISIPLDISSNMTISATKALERI